MGRPHPRKKLSQKRPGRAGYPSLGTGTALSIGWEFLTRIREFRYSTQCNMVFRLTTHRGASVLRRAATSFDEVIYTVQSQHSHGNQIDRDGETHDTRCYHEKYPGRERGDRQEGVCSIEVHPKPTEKAKTRAYTWPTLPDLHAERRKAKWRTEQLEAIAARLMPDPNPERRVWASRRSPSADGRS
jgi:hypothetical protein